MKFDFKKRTAEFGVFNNRRELHGEERVKAIDLPMRFQISLKELDMVIPAQGIPLSQFMYGLGAKAVAKGRTGATLQTFVLPELKVHRKPEHIVLTVYDDDTDKRKCMRFEEVKIKDPVVEFEEQGVVWIRCKAQFQPGNLLARISDNVEATARQFEMKASQPELFDEPEKDDGEEGGEQADIEDQK